MIFNQAKTILVVVDVQGKLADTVHEKDRLFKSIDQLIVAFQILDIPIIFTEQAPHKIGTTIPSILERLEDRDAIKKQSFSCCREEEFMAKIAQTGKKQVVVAGIEAHVCIIQTAADLILNNYQVQVVADAVSSRVEENKVLAIERMKKMGVDITTTEMVICELLKGADHSKFKEVMQLIK